MLKEEGNQTHSWLVAFFSVIDNNPKKEQKYLHYPQKIWTVHFNITAKSDPTGAESVSILGVAVQQDL